MTAGNKAFSTSIFGVPTEVVPLNPRLDGGEPENGLQHCYAAWINGKAVIRSAEIDSENTALGLYLASEYISKERKSHPKASLKICSNQLDSIRLDWDTITRQHRVLLAKLQQGREFAIVHLSTGMEAFYMKSLPRKVTEADQKALQDMPRLLNLEAWAAYCSWYCRSLENAFKGVRYDAADAYTLERYIKDLQHEVDSLFLDQTKKRIRELELSMHPDGKAKILAYQELVKTEKELIFARKDLYRMVKAHYEILVQIINLIEVIETAHPELSNLKFIGSILERLLSSQLNLSSPLHWGNEQLLLQLLNDSMGLISAVNSKVGVDRANIAFSVRMAALQLGVLYSKEEILDFSKNWDQAMRSLSRFPSERDPVSQISDPAQRKHAEILEAFRIRIGGNLDKVCRRITGEIIASSPTPSTEDLYPNTVILDLLPSYLEIDGKEIRLVECEAQSGEPRGLTEEGHLLVLSNSQKKYS